MTSRPRYLLLQSSDWLYHFLLGYSLRIFAELGLKLTTLALWRSQCRHLYVCQLTMLRILLPTRSQTHPSNDTSNHQLRSLPCHGKLALSIGNSQGYRKHTWNEEHWITAPTEVSSMASHIALFRPILSPMKKLTMHPDKQPILYMDTEPSF